jgi:hypothetical protein
MAHLNWIIEGKPCRILGILQDQLLAMEKVPNVAQAAMMDPRYQVVL